MSVYRSPELIKSFIENYPKNIEQSIAQMGQKNKKISNILDGKYRYSNEKFEYSLDLGDLFENAYFQSIGFGTSPQFIKELNCYQQLLKNSFTMCNDLTPLFINAFMHYWIAAQFGATRETQESFITSMHEIGKMGKEIASQYKSLEKAFELARNRIMKIGCRLHKNRVTIFSAFDCKKDPLAKKMITSLDSAMKSTLIMDNYLLDARALFGKGNFYMHMLSADTSILTEPTCLDGPSAEQSQESQVVEEFQQQLGRREIMITRIIITPLQPLQLPNQPLERKENIPTSNRDELQSTPPDKSHSTQCVREMKTGRKLVPPPEIPKTSLTQVIQSMSTDVERVFEETFLEWVAVAKINQETVSSLRRVIFTIEMTKQRMLLTEKDPLVIALNGTSS